MISIIVLITNWLLFVIYCVGRDNDKGKQKRVKKASKLKSEILRTIGTADVVKKEVVFNEDARVQWLTGFQKRKTMRRQYGVAMQVICISLYRLYVRLVYCDYTSFLVLKRQKGT